MKKFWIEHSLSLVLAIGFILTTIYSYYFTEPGNWLYDYVMSLTGSFGGGILLVVCSKFFWERGSDPATPPEAIKDMVEDEVDSKCEKKKS